MNKFIKLNDECYLHSNQESIKYDVDYFENFRERYYSEIGTKLNKFRKTYVECFSADGDIIDVGTGFGGLVTEHDSKRWYGYDINPLTKNRLGKLFDENLQNYNNICFFDVLEHYKNPIDLLNNIKNNARVFITIPLWSGDWSNFESSITNWKHWRENEHYLYASPKGFKEFMKNNEFYLLDENQIEMSLGRQEVYTFAFEKKSIIR